MTIAKSRTLVLGAGAWGTALALALTRNVDNEVYLWGRDRSAMQKIRQRKLSDRYLPGIALPESLHILVDDDFPEDIDLVIAAVPFQTLRDVLTNVASKIKGLGCIACACKGIEEDTLLRADQIVAEVVSSSTDFAILSGPNFAIEVAEQRPAAITIATANDFWAQELVGRFHSDSFRPYSSEDVIGVQIGGALKNVIAIAAGIGDGLELGANSRAALITRGLAEITRFGIAQGGQLETFMGLSGVGDLVLTCTDDKSRNRRFGLALAHGASVRDAIADVGLVEGAKTAIALVKLAEQMNISLPISLEVAGAVAGLTSPEQAVQNLLARDPVAESAGLTRAIPAPR
ncbi:MAG: glycerol-3-phosphate dehydrogenase (NAD(P)+) [Gammaproteobacteria bacterium]|jgi:glycerol-3-phosphate dehydrogenase (NAD(P)+)